LSKSQKLLKEKEKRLEVKEIILQLRETRLKDKTNELLITNDKIKHYENQIASKDDKLKKMGQKLDTFQAQVRSKSCVNGIEGDATYMHYTGYTGHRKVCVRQLIDACTIYIRACYYFAGPKKEGESCVESAETV